MKDHVYLKHPDGVDGWYPKAIAVVLLANSNGWRKATAPKKAGSAAEDTSSASTGALTKE